MTASDRPEPDPRRRRLLAAAASLAAVPLAARASRLVATPRQTRGPFYPLDLPLERDNDLVAVRGAPPARGVVTHVGGRVLDQHAAPVARARVEIWQCDAFGRFDVVLKAG